MFRFVSETTILNSCIAVGSNNLEMCLKHAQQLTLLELSITSISTILPANIYFEDREE